MGNNCEHLVTIATLGFPVSVQINKIVYQALRCSRGAVRTVRLSAIHNSCHVTPECSMHACHLTPEQSMHACTAKGGVASVTKSGMKSAAKSTTKSTAKAASKSASKSATKSVAKMGTKAAASGTVLGAIAGIAFAVNVLIETPLCIRNLYKLHRQRKFEMISEQEFKRKRDRAMIVAASAVTGGTAGAVIGQAVIPVPVFGAAAGGFVGNVVGQSCGYFEGWAIGKFTHPDPCDITLPEVVTTKYLDISKLDSENLKVFFDNTHETTLELQSLLQCPDYL